MSKADVSSEVGGVMTTTALGVVGRTRIKEEHHA